jgi:hypothetical protein
MSDGNLLALGCAVSFIAVSGFYVYLRDCWTKSAQAIRVKEQSAPVLRKR